MPCDSLQSALSSELILNAGDLATLKQLLLNGAEINYQSHEGWCLLFELISLGAYETIKVLSTYDFDLQIRDTKERNAIFWAIYHENSLVLKTLIQLGASIHTTVSQGLPTLHYAVYKENLSIVQLLLSHGIDPECEDCYGNKAIDYARLHNCHAIESLLSA